MSGQVSPQSAPPQVGSPARRLSRAVEHVSRMWLPINTELLKKMRSGLAANTFDLDHEILYSEIASDAGLFTYCLRELSKLTGSNPRKFEQPSDLFNAVGFLRTKELLLADRRQVTVHSFESASALQQARYKELIITSATAQTLAPSVNVSSTLAYETGVLRQLGLTLIAWNYPATFQKALAGLSREKTLDAALNEMLGFSPELLTVSLAQNWGVGDDVIQALGEKKSFSLESNEPPKPTAELANSLTHLCKVGEALARVSNATQYPTAQNDWEMAKSVIETHLGSKGMLEIREAVRQGAKALGGAIPVVSGELTNFDPERSVMNSSDERVYIKNPFLKNCSPDIRRKVKQAYKKMSEKEVSREALSDLLGDIIPACGFSGAVIYLFEPTTQTLSPRTKIGTLGLHPVERVSAIPSRLETNPITNAFHCENPVTEDGRGNRNSLLSSVSGAIGKRKHLGVLYLEVPTENYERDGSAVLLLFRMLRQALGDCLLAQ